MVVLPGHAISLQHVLIHVPNFDPPNCPKSSPYRYIRSILVIHRRSAILAKPQKHFILQSHKMLRFYGQFRAVKIADPVLISMSNIQSDPALLQPQPMAHHHSQSLWHVLHLLPTAVLWRHCQSVARSNPGIALRQKQVGPDVIIYARPQQTLIPILVQIPPILTIEMEAPFCSQSMISKIG